MSTASSDGIARVARAMLHEFDDILATVSELVWTRVPGYSESMRASDELRDRIAESIRLLLMCLLEGRSASADELSRSAATGERRALQGLPATALIQSFRTSERVLSDELQGWCTRMQVPPAAARAARAALLANVDALEGVMMKAYAEIERQIEMDRRLSEPAFFRRLMSGEAISASDADRLARSLGIANPMRTAFVTVAVSSAAIDRPALERLRHRLTSVLARTLERAVLSGDVQPPTIDAGDSGQSVIMIAIPWQHTSDSLLPQLDIALTSAADGDHSIRAGVSEPSSGLADLGEACLHAVEALETASRLRLPQRTVVHTDILAEILVHREPSIARRLIERYLDDLASPELFQTLRTHLGTGQSLSATAASLGVHKNTIVYRLRRIEESTGLDLHDSRDITRATLALIASDLDAASSPRSN